MKIHEQIQYIEFLSKELEKVKKFYQNAFGWNFTDFGPEYTAFEGKYIEGGFTIGQPAKGSILPVLYSEKLEETSEKIKLSGGQISKEIFSFPGGRRFHFTDPDSNELAVWSDRDVNGNEIRL
jgi:hypothetical protein